MAILHAQNALMKTRSLRIGPRLTRFHRVATAVEGCYVPMWSGLAKYFPGRRSRKPCKLPLSVTSSFLLVLLAPSSQRPPCLRLPNVLALPLPFSIWMLLHLHQLDTIASMDRLAPSYKCCSIKHGRFESQQGQYSWLFSFT